MAGASTLNIPRGWREVGRIPLGQRAQLAFQVVGVLILGAIVLLSEMMLRQRGLVELYLSTHGAALICLAGILITVPAHEALHGLAALGLGYRPRFGVGRSGLLPYAWCSANAVFYRRAFLICSLTPLLVLDTLGASLLATDRLALLGYAILVANTMGALADLWGVLYLSRFPRGSAVWETRSTNLILRPAD